jgi:hypothetical protein
MKHKNPRSILNAVTLRPSYSRHPLYMTVGDVQSRSGRNGEHRSSDSHAASMKMAVFWIVTSCSLVEVYRRFIVLMMEAASTSKTSVNFYRTTRHNTPEDSHVHMSSCLCFTLNVIISYTWAMKHSGDWWLTRTQTVTASYCDDRMVWKQIYLQRRNTFLYPIRPGNKICFYFNVN